MGYTVLEFVRLASCAQLGRVQDVLHISQGMLGTATILFTTADIVHVIASDENSGKRRTRVGELTKMLKQSMSSGVDITRHFSRWAMTHGRLVALRAAPPCDADISVF
jgi:hypothetical protein